MGGIMLHYRKISGLILCVGIALIWSDESCAAPAGEDRTGRRLAESLRLRCGPRAAWAFSRCCGTPLDHDETMAAFVREESAVSLAEIAAFLNSRGIRCEMRCLSPTDLTNDICPAIVYLAPGNEVDPYGHFVVVVGTDARGVTVVEPQVGKRQRWTWQYFSDRWTGHGIMRAQHQSFERRMLWLCMGLNLLVTLCVYFRQ